MITTENLIEQLIQIRDEQPVRAGNLLHKQAKDEAVKRDLVLWYDDEENGVIGYCLTQKGKDFLNNNCKND